MTKQKLIFSKSGLFLIDIIFFDFKPIEDINIIVEGTGRKLTIIRFQVNK